MRQEKAEARRADIPLWRPQKAPRWSSGDAPVERARRTRVRRKEAGK